MTEAARPCRGGCGAGPADGRVAARGAGRGGQGHVRVRAGRCPRQRRSRRPVTAAERGALLASPVRRELLRNRQSREALTGRVSRKWPRTQCRQRHAVERSVRGCWWRQTRGEWPLRAAVAVHAAPQPNAVHRQRAPTAASDSDLKHSCSSRFSRSPRKAARIEPLVAYSLAMNAPDGRRNPIGSRPSPLRLQPAQQLSMAPHRCQRAPRPPP
jgi:hypothetical protein